MYNDFEKFLRKYLKMIPYPNDSLPYPEHSVKNRQENLH